MRFVEIALLLLPIAVFVAWRMIPSAVGPPRSLVVAVTVTVGVLAALLLVMWYQDTEPPNSAYVPARVEDGRVVPSQVLPKNGPDR